MINYCESYLHNRKNDISYCSQYTRMFADKNNRKHEKQIDYDDTYEPFQHIEHVDMINHSMCYKASDSVDDHSQRL